MEIGEVKVGGRGELSKQEAGWLAGCAGLSIAVACLRQATIGTLAYCTLESRPVLSCRKQLHLDPDDVPDAHVHVPCTFHRLTLKRINSATLLNLGNNTPIVVPPPTSISHTTI